MLKKYSILISFFFGFSTAVQAVPFEPTFSDYTFPGSQFTVDAAANTFFAANYGITVDNAYLYVDSRDTFDGIGISVGAVSDIGTPQVGTIAFLDSTDFVSIDYWGIQPTTYSIFNLTGGLLDMFSIGANVLGTYDYIGTERIGSLTWASDGGFGQISGLRYDYDGTTGGGNTDLDPKSVPEASSIMLLGLGMVGLMFSRRKKTT